MWQARTKQDLIIEVWEKLDCESVGLREIVDIETAVREVYGPGAVESPMKIARLLADEGAVLRHPEIVELDVMRRLGSPYQAMFRNIRKADDTAQALASIRRLENLRQKFLRESDKEGLRLLNQTGKRCREDSLAILSDPKANPEIRAQNAEIAEWFTIWLQSPEVFETWVQVRQQSPEFREKFKTLDVGGSAED